MATATDPQAPQRDLSVNELRAGYGYGSGVSYVNGVPNPSGQRSGRIFICKDASSLVNTVASANFGDDIVIPNGTANAITISSSMVTFPTLTTITAATPRVSPPPMMDYTSATGLAIAAPKAMTTAPPAMASAPVLASVVPQGDPSYVRIMSGQAEQVTVPPPHTTWHITNYQRFAHLIQGDQFTAILGTPDVQTIYLHNHFRMEGIRFVNHAHNGIGFFVSLGSSNGAPNRAPDHFIYDRIYLDGDVSGNGVVPAGDGSNRGISGQYDYMGFINSRSHGIWRTASGDYNLEANTLAPTSCLGPLHVENSWLTGAGEVTLSNYGGNAALPAPYEMSDVTFTRNWCLRPLSWRETFAYNCVQYNQIGQATMAVDAGGSNVTVAFGGAGNRFMGQDAEGIFPGDLFYTPKTGRMVAVSAITGQLTCSLASPYTEEAGNSNLTGIFVHGRQLIDGGSGSTVTLSGTGNRTVTGSGTLWTQTVKPYVDTPPPGCGVFFGVNTNLTSAAANQKIYPVLIQVASVDSDTQMTLSANYTTAAATFLPASTFTNVYYTVSFWDGNCRSVMKNLHEWKGSNRVRTIGNVFENAWATFNGQGSNAIAFNTPSGGGGYHRDDYVGYNLLVNTGLHCYYVSNPWATFPPPQDPSLYQSTRFCMEHNLMVDSDNVQWQTPTTQTLGLSLPFYNLNPAGLGGARGFVGTKDWQFRHNAVIESTDYPAGRRLLYPSTQDPATINQQFVFQDNVAHVGSHATIINNSPSGFTGGSTSEANADANDADGNLNGTNGGYPVVTTDSVVAGNVFMRYSAATIAAHTTQYGGFNSGFGDESSVAFLSYRNASNIPRWLTQSTDARDYALTTIYQTNAGACTVTGSTVTISSGTIPTTVAAGTPFRVSGDGAASIGRVQSRDSATQVTLTANYTGTTGSGKTGLFSFVGAGTDSRASTIFISGTGLATVSNITAVSYTETFTHADANSLTADQTWTQTLGTNWGIRSNAANLFGTAGSTNQVAICQTDLQFADHTASVTVTAFTLASNAQCGPIVRSNASGSRFYVFRSVPSGGNQFDLGYTTDGGFATFTELATYNGTTAAAGQTLTLSAVSTTLTASINGTVVMQVTDGTISTGNFCGLWGFRGTAGDAVSADPFTATTIGFSASRVTLSGDTFPLAVTPSSLFTRTFRAQGDAATLATGVLSYNSATQITLSAPYGGTTGTGITAVIEGQVPTGVDPGPNTTALWALVGNIRT